MILIDFPNFMKKFKNAIEHYQILRPMIEMRQANGFKQIQYVTVAPGLHKRTHLASTACGWRHYLEPGPL